MCPHCHVREKEGSHRQVVRQLLNPRDDTDGGDGHLLPAQPKVPRVRHERHRGADGGVIIQRLAHALKVSNTGVCEEKGKSKQDFFHRYFGFKANKQWKTAVDASGTWMHEGKPVSTQEGCLTMKTMLRTAGMFHRACISCSTISPAVRSPLRPMVPVEQKVQPI